MHTVSVARSHYSTKDYQMLSVGIVGVLKTHLSVLVVFDLLWELKVDRQLVDLI